MINIQKAKQEFKKYVNNYDIENYKIKIKVVHTENVVNIAREIAKNQKLENEDIQLAQLIGLLHDIGRFEQVKRYNTFVDKDSINHGELGVKILFDQGLIKQFIEDRKYDEIIKRCILNHNINRESIQFSNEREKKHSEIIRDADKTDILDVLSKGDKKELYGKEDISKEKMSDEIYREFIEEKTINYQERKTAVDFLVSHFAYIYDFYNVSAMKIVKEKGYFEKLYKRFEFEDEQTKKRIKEIYKIVEKYLENS